MQKTARALKAGVKAALGAMGPGRYQAAERIISCGHCQGELFREREALLNSTGATLMNLDWLDKSGTALVCEKCSLIQWFGQHPQRV